MTRDFLPPNPRPMEISWSDPGPPPKQKRGAKPAAVPTRRGRYGRKRRARLVALGLCVSCAREPLVNATLGVKCRAREREKARERGRRLRAEGICARCAKAPATGSGYCDACYLIWRDQKDAYEARKLAAGLCRKCTKPREETAKEFCAACEVRVRENEHRARKKRRLAKIAGRPCSCGKVKGTMLRRDGSVCCQDCRFPIQHGTHAGHARGCRCEPCVTGYRAYINRRHAARRLEELAGRICACGQAEPRMLRIRADGRVQCVTCKGKEQPPPPAWREPRPVVHGTVTAYANGKCRCPDCLRAHTAYRRNLRQQRAGAAA